MAPSLESRAAASGSDPSEDSTAECGIRPHPLRQQRLQVSEESGNQDCGTDDLPRRRFPPSRSQRGLGNPSRWPMLCGNQIVRCARTPLLRRRNVNERGDSIAHELIRVPQSALNDKSDRAGTGPRHTRAVYNDTRVRIGPAERAQAGRGVSGNRTRLGQLPIAQDSVSPDISNCPESAVKTVQLLSPVRDPGRDEDPRETGDESTFAEPRLCPVHVACVNKCCQTPHPSRQRAHSPQERQGNGPREDPTGQSSREHH